MKFSLILATLNRSTEIDAFFYSASMQYYKDFEIIVIDQNEQNFLAPIIEKWKPFLSIIHTRIEVKGLSFARNVGLKMSTGDIVCFPDDDCKYYPDTLKVVHDLFEKHRDHDIFLGRIVDEKGQNILKSWSVKQMKIGHWRLLKTASSITLFVRKNDLFFDPRLGAGSFFGSCEDVDYIYRLLLFFKNRALYNPQIAMWHPHEDILSLNLNKIDSYGRGFGAYIKKNLSLPNITLFCLVLLYHFFFFFTALLRFDRESAIKRWHYIQSRIEGFLRFQKN